jgi:hypothetical protein
VNAITFVAIGAALPDTFASMIAAQQVRYDLGFDVHRKI